MPDFERDALARAVESVKFLLKALPAPVEAQVRAEEADASEQFAELEARLPRLG